MERSEALNLFTDVTKVDVEMAQHYLEACQWDVETAINIWTANENVQEFVNEENRLDDMMEEDVAVVPSPRSNEAVDNENDNKEDENIQAAIDESLMINHQQLQPMTSTTSNTFKLFTIIKLKNNII